MLVTRFIAANLSDERVTVAETTNCPGDLADFRPRQGYVYAVYVETHFIAGPKASDLVEFI